MYKTKAEIEKTFKDQGLTCSIRDVVYKDAKIQWTQAGNEESTKLVIFIHGAPGSSSDFLSYLLDEELRAEALLVAVDRLGYGESDYGIPYPMFKDQVEGIREVLKTFNNKQVIIVSHSYGGPIGVLLASESGNNIIAHIALAPVVSAAHEPYNFVMKIPSLPILEYLFSGAIQVSSHEKAVHQEQLRITEKQMRLDDLKTIVIHGKKDMIAPYQNAEFLEEKSPNQVKLVLLEDENHFIPWTQFELVKKHIVQSIY